MDTVTRRQVLSGVAAAAAILASRPSIAATKSKRSGLLVRPDDLQQFATRCKIVLELDGTLEVANPDPAKAEEAKEAKVRGKSTLEYSETIAYSAGAPLIAARIYSEATSENWVAGSSMSQSLRPQCTATLVQQHGGTWQQFCPSMPLDKREVELIHSPINSLALEQLLPDNPAKPDELWDVSKEAARELFNLEAVHKSTLAARIAKVEKGVATIKLQGTLEATNNSVATRLDVDGNFQAKLGSQSAFVNWIGLAIKENREISQAEPGFDITARVRLIRAEENEIVSHERLISQAKDQEDGRWLVRLQSEVGKFSMLADRRWTTYIDSGEESILRMIENNVSIAQCNVNYLPALDEGSQLTLEGLQADIKESLGDAFGSFLEAREKVTSSKLRLLRVVVAGELEEVPIHWIYCHLSNDTGKRCVLVYTMSADQAEAFAAEDEQMVSSFEMLQADDTTLEGPKAAPKLTEKPTPAATR